MTRLPSWAQTVIVFTVFPLLIYIDLTSPKVTGMWMLFSVLIIMWLVGLALDTYRKFYPMKLIRLTEHEEAALAASKDFRELMSQLENVHGLAIETIATNPEEALAVLKQLNLNIYNALNPSQE